MVEKVSKNVTNISASAQENLKVAEEGDKLANNVGKLAKDLGEIVNRFRL